MKSKKIQIPGYQSDPVPAVPWPEWSEPELNSEKWDSPKNGTDGRFVDPEPFAMPPSLQELLHGWKRGSTLNDVSSDPVVFTSGKLYPGNFSKNNKHIMHSEFVRWFVSTMTNLEYAGRDGLRVDGELLLWQGWMHVYSMNKANTVSQHHPIVNPNGKYVIRLYFMGFWRRFIVDDMIPVDVDSRPLLPRTENDFELWPMLLAKAMMKLASLSWTNRREINDFHPVSCLTGWICLPLATRCMSSNEKWDLLTRYIEDENCAESPSSADKKARIHDRRPNAAILAYLAGEAVPVYIDKLRDNMRGSLPQMRWKAYRWFDWASKHGKAKTPGSALRSLRLVSPCESSAGFEVWKDFDEIGASLEEIFIFYEASDFQYCTRISDVVPESQVHVSATSSRVKSQATGKKPLATSASSVASAPGFLREFKWRRNVSASKHDPMLYMLVDSVDTKFILIEFCSLPEAKPPSARSYLIVERYNFFEKSSDDDPAALIKTFSAGATILEAGPGRHVCRILFRAGCSYLVRILSDTLFHVGDRFKIQDLMSFESDRIDAIVRNMSNRLSAAVREFGRPEFASHLRAFYSSYTPNDGNTVRSNEDKKLIKIIHRLFIEELTKLVRETFAISETTTSLHALRVFFLNPAIGISSEPNNRNAEYEVDSIMDNSIHERAAVKIQSFFRMMLVKFYKRVQDPLNARHSTVEQSLRKLVDLFNYTKRESAANLLIRKMIDICPALYPCHEDLSHVLNVEEWKGVARNIQPGQWVPLLRVVVNSPSTEATVCASMDFTTGLPRKMIRVVNNENCREVNGTATARYPYARRGYTVIGYGWSDGSKIKELDWSVRLMTVKGQPTFIPQTSSPRPSLLVQELSNTYVPNASNVIGKWIVAVSTDCLLSFRISTSYTMAETMMQVVDKNGTVLCQAEGGSCLILPAVCLSFEINRAKYEVPVMRKSRSASLVSLDSYRDDDDTITEYYVRVYVLNDSWPLTPAEWVVAKEAEARGTVYDPRHGRISVSKRGARSRLQVDAEVPDGSSATIPQHPLCRLQILTDVGTKVQVERDRRRETEVAGMKRLWEVAEPGRLLRGRGLRDEFLSEKSVAVTTPTDTEVRTLKPPAILSQVIPAWNVDGYVMKDEEEERRWVKTENDEEMLRNQRRMYLLEFDQTQEAYVDEEAAQMQEQRERYSALFESYMNKSSYWKSLADTACEKRDKYLSELKSAIASKTAKNAKKKKKK